jgi:hypothetical protein
MCIRLDGPHCIQHLDILLEIEELDAIGGRGVYVLGLFRSEEDVEQVSRDVEPYR